MGRIKKLVILSALLVIFLFTSSCGHAAQPVQVNLAAGGKALQRVVTGPAASDGVKQSAAELAAYLGRISGATFEVVTGDGSSGLAVGLPGDFPDLDVRTDFQPERPTGRDDYLLRTHPKGVYLLGATETAVSHAVWDFLYRLGYRQFFPGEHWEVVPQLSKVSIALDTLQSPSYNSRNLSSSTSRARSGPEAFGDKEAYANWQKRNRLGFGWKGIGGHIYGFIIRARKAEFEAHPEYLAMVDGKRGGSKLCVSNPALRKLVVDYALEQLKKDPTGDAISMEPSDGGGFCECPECAKLGSISDQVVTLANEVAEAVSKTYPGKYVSILAYNFHTAPPNIRLHPAIVVTICAGQLTGNWKPEELFDAWAAKGANANKAGFGVFEYYSNIVGNQFLPGRVTAANIGYIKSTIADFHRRGARRFSSGVAYSNGTVSLGAYMAARMLWDVRETERADELYRDFLDKCFPGAKKPMDAFFRLIYRFDFKEARMPFTEDTVARMYRALQEAFGKATDSAERRRIQDMILYTRYAELHLNYAKAPAAGRAEAYSEAMRHAWRMRREMMVNVNGLFVYPSSIMPEAEVHWRVPADKNPWKRGEFYTDEEIALMLKDGVANTRMGEYKLKAFSADLVPAFKALQFEDKPLGSKGFGLPPGGTQVFYTWVDKAPGEIKLQIAGGFIWPKRAGNVKITLYSDKAFSDAADFVVTRDESVPPDQQDHLVVLRTPHTGYHRIEIEGGPGSTRVLPGEEGMAFTVQAGPVTCFNNRFIWEGWFYVPKGTKEVSFHAANPQGEIMDGAGKPVFSFRRPYRSGAEILPAATSGGYYTIAVPAGEDGRLWKLDGANGSWLLLNVPPYMARRPSELLLPSEVVEADK